MRSLINRFLDRLIDKYCRPDNMFDDPIMGPIYHDILYGKRYIYRLRGPDARKTPPLVNLVFGAVDRTPLSKFMRDALRAAEAVHERDLPLLFAPFGMGPEGPVVVDFTQVRQLLISGMQGYGKTKAAVLLLLGMLWGNSPDAVDFHVLDLKREDMADFAGVVNYQNRPSEMVKLLEELKKRVAFVQKRLQVSGNKTIDAHNLAMRKADKPLLKYQVVLIEEYAALFEEVPKAQEVVRYLSRIGRSSGIFFIFSTQMADKGAMMRGIKANISGFWSFRQIDEHAAKVAGILEAQSLQEVGDSFLRVGSRLEQVKVPRFTSDQQLAALHSLRRLRNVGRKHPLSQPPPPPLRGGEE